MIFFLFFFIFKHDKVNCVAIQSKWMFPFLDYMQSGTSSLLFCTTRIALVSSFLSPLSSLSCISTPFYNSIKRWKTWMSEDRRPHFCHHEWTSWCGLTGSECGHHTASHKAQHSVKINGDKQTELDVKNEKNETVALPGIESVVFSDRCRSQRYNLRSIKRSY